MAGTEDANLSEQCPIENLKRPSIKWRLTLAGPLFMVACVAFTIPLMKPSSVASSRSLSMMADDWWLLTVLSVS